MATARQKLAVDKLVENGGNVTKAMLDAKYSPATANTPKKLTESDGFKELCEEAGLTDGLLTKALVEDIKKKKGNRKAELELGFKVRGRLSDKQEFNQNLIINIPNEVANRFKINGTNTETSRSD